MSLLLMAEAMIFLHVQKSLPLHKNVTNVIQREHLRQRTKTESSFRKNDYQINFEMIFPKL